MPMPSSISSSPRSKVGVPAAGVVPEVSAVPKLRARSLTFLATAATVPRSAPVSANPPAIFSTSGVAPVPRRPAVYRLSSTATSSFTRTDSRYQAHLARNRRVGPIDDLVLHVHSQEVRVRRRHALQRVLDHVLGSVDELLHVDLLCSSRIREVPVT